MDAGRYRHRVKIEEITDHVLSDGATPDDWQEICTVWAAVEPISGREYFAAEQAQSEISHKVKLRYRAGIKPGMRIHFGGRELAIVSVIDYGESREILTLMCKERVQ